MAKSEDGEAIGSQRMIKKEAEKDKILVSTAEHRIIHLSTVNRPYHAEAETIRRESGERSPSWILGGAYVPNNFINI